MVRIYVALFISGCLSRFVVAFLPRNHRFLDCRHEFHCQPRKQMLISRLPLSLSEPDNTTEQSSGLLTRETNHPSPETITEKELPKVEPSFTSPPPQPPATLSSRDMMQALGTSPRRIFVSLLAGTGIALAGNLFGVTSTLLQNVDEQVVETTGLDTYFPRGPYKRYQSPDYTFVVPKEWVADTAVELAKAQRRTKSLDYSMAKTSRGYLPDAAFGPPGKLDARGLSQGDTNVSVIRNNLGPDFSLPGIMKSPEEGAHVLLEKFIAPPGSGREATLIAASEEEGLYRFSYRIDRQNAPALQAISVLAERNGVLFTLTVVAPQAMWVGESKTKLTKVADSFHLR